jgi:hypothetical protein
MGYGKSLAVEMERKLAKKQKKAFDLLKRQREIALARILVKLWTEFKSIYKDRDYNLKEFMDYLAFEYREIEETRRSDE